MNSSETYTLRIVFDNEVAPKVVLKNCTFKDVIEYLNNNYSNFKNAGIYISRDETNLNFRD